VLLTASLKPMLRCKRSITTLKIEISESVGEVAVLKERKLRATGVYYVSQPHIMQQISNNGQFLLRYRVDVESTSGSPREREKIIR